jgi:hypothetical protein
MKTTVVRTKFAPWQAGFVVILALLSLGSVSAYAEESSDSSETPAAADLLQDNGEPLEDSLQPEATLEDSPLTEEITEQNQLDAVTEEVDQHIHEAEAEPSEVEGVIQDSTEEASTIGGDGYLPDASEGAVEVEL